MAMPIIVVKENPGTLVVEVIEKRGGTEHLVATLRLPEVKVKLKEGAKVNGAEVTPAAEYRLELRDV